MTSGCFSDKFTRVQPEPPAVNPVTSYNITGFVRDYQGSPVSGARVSLLQNGTPVNITDNPQISGDGHAVEAGRFSFNRTNSGQYTILAEKDGKSGSATYPGSLPIEIFLNNSSMPQPAPAVSNSPGYFTRTYNWSYKGEWTTTINIPEQLYEFYRSQPHDRQDNYAQYALSDYDRASLKSLIEMFNDSGEKYGYTDNDDVLSIVNFVQALPYTSDIVTTGYDEYPRYPIETLVDDGGDCEDTAILTAALLNEMGYSVVLLELPDHMAVGVKCADDYSGTYVEYRGSRYYYLETTGENWLIGQLPDEYAGQNMTIYPMVQSPRMDMSFNATCEDSDSSYLYYRVHCNITNIGAGTAGNVSAMITMLDPDNDHNAIWGPNETVMIGDVAEGSTGWAEATIRVPRNTDAQIECILNGDNFEPVTMKTKTFDT